MSTSKRNPNLVSVASTLSDEQMKRWKAITVNSHRSYADAFILLIDILTESKIGIELLKFGGYIVPPVVEQKDADKSNKETKGE